LAVAPDIHGRSTASLRGAIAPKAFAPLLAAGFSRLLNAWRTSEPDAFARAWLARAHPIGTPGAGHGGANETVAGIFAGIEPDGALKLTVDGEIQIIRAGDVHLN
jgi:BirA family biotin operon repressor/biotin-[acetyl-CoA-carboxylase] ligase